jgi:MFS family permease
MLIIGSALYSMVFFLSLYLQEILHYSALKNGFAYLAFALVVVITAAIAQATVTHQGVRLILVVGMVCTTIALLLFARLPLTGHYFTDLFPGFVIGGIGLGFSVVAVSIAAVIHITNEEAGVASGLINTSQQVGGALGLAILLAVATARTNSRLHAGLLPPHAVLSGFHAAFLVSALLAPLAIVLAVTVLPGGRLDPEPQEVAPVQA